MFLPLSLLLCFKIEASIPQGQTWRQYFGVEVKQENREKIPKHNYAYVCTVHCIIYTYSLSETGDKVKIVFASFVITIYSQRA